MMVHVHIDHTAVQQALSKLPVKARSRAVLRGLSAAGGVIRNAAVALTARDTGALARSLKVKAAVPTDLRKAPFVLVGPERHHVEFVRNKAGKWRRWSQPTALYSRSLRALNKAKTPQERLKIAGSMVRNLSDFLTRRRDVRRVKLAIHVARQAFPEAQYRRPVRYAHLVEKGTRRGARARPFLGPAIQSAMPAAVAAMAAQVAAAVAGRT